MGEEIQGISGKGRYVWSSDMAIIGYLLSCVFIHWYKLDESLHATILESIAVVEFLLGTLFVDSAVRYFSLLFYRKVTIFMC